MLGQTTNPILQQTEQALQAKVAPAVQNAFQSAVTAGLHIMYSPQSHQMMVAQLTKPGDPLENVAEGAAKLTGELYKQSRGTMPVHVMAPATMLFACEGLDFLSKMKSMQITPDMVAQVGHDVGQNVLKLMGVSQQQLHQVVSHGMALRDQQMQQQGQPPQAQLATTQGTGIIQSAMGAK